MKQVILTAAAALALLSSCKMENPFLTESKLAYNAPEFDKIKTEHYKPAFEAGIAEGKANVDRIVANTDAPCFANVIVPMEFASPILDKVSGVFYNLLEADTNDEMQALAEELSPMMTEYSMYISLNQPLFRKVKAVYENREKENLKPNELRLLEQTYKSFVRSGANLNDEDKKTFAELSEKASLLSLQFGKNVLAATNAFTLNVTDPAKLAGMPQYILTQGAETAAEKGQEGWTFTLQAPSYGPFLKYCADRDLRKELYMAYNTRAVGGEFDNSQTIKDIADTRIKIANLLGYPTYADYALEERMAKDKETVLNFLESLMTPTLPFARAEVKEIEDFAHTKGFEGKLEGWDFSFWSERLKEEKYSFNAEELKPYFELESCIGAAFSLAGRLYGLQFEPIDLPVYHKDVKVYDVKDAAGNHKALFYADFFPRESKRGGAWMTEFRGQSIENGVEKRPFISIVCNFTKPTAGEPSLITHDEFTTFLHEFGHSLHGILAEGEFPSQTGTNVARDFVELPSQINENWCFEPEFLNSFAKHYKTGETIPAELLQKIIDSQNYLSAYGQVRQLHFGTIDMAWHTLTAVPQDETAKEFEKRVLRPYGVLPETAGTSFCQSFNHIFSGGYAAGYYSYKWAEVLEADAFSLFKENGIFDKATADSFRENILTRGDSEDPAVLYRRFRGRDPQPEALMRKLGLVK
ncbi:MAG: M3 family metallopeptidase [Bacteroidales bacterium]|nr:M3 family metallopeptidase [Candidatus Hennigimonas equi]